MRLGDTAASQWAGYSALPERLSASPSIDPQEFDVLAEVFRDLLGHGEIGEATTDVRHSVQETYCGLGDLISHAGRSERATQVTQLPTTRGEGHQECREHIAMLEIDKHVRVVDMCERLSDQEAQVRVKERLFG